MRLLFTRGPQLGLRLLTLVILSIVLLVLDHSKNYLAPVRSTLSAVVAPLQYTIDAPIKFFHNLSTNFSSRQTLLAENASLQARQLLLQAKLQQLLALQNENSQLRALLASSPHARNERTTVAQLLAVDTDPLTSEVVLDKGQRSDIYVGQPVLDAKGVMGQVIQIGPLTSRVLLINDTRSAVPIQDTRNGIRGLVIGRGHLNKLALTDVPITVDVKVGDILVTSGLGGHYPAGYPIGVVTHIHQNPNEQFAAIDVTPSAQLDRNQTVLLVWPQQAPLIDAPKVQIEKANKAVKKQHTKQ